MLAHTHLIELHRQIQDGRYPTPKSLAAQLDIDERSVYRHRRQLEKLGAQIAWDKKRKGWYYLDPTFTLPTVLLSENELLAFFLSVEIARSTTNPGFRENLGNAVTKIKTGVGDMVSVDLNALRDSTTYAVSPAARVDAQLYTDLSRAGAARQQVRMHYYTASRGQWTERTIHPYHLHFTRGEWLLLAFDPKKAKVLCFNIARIAKLEPQKTHFQRHPNFDPASYIRTMFFAEKGDTTFEVQVKFDQYQSRYIKEREWHPEQTLTENDDGTTLLKFPASSLQEITRWVLGYGRHAQALSPPLSPPELVSLIKSHVEDLHQTYKKEG